MNVVGSALEHHVGVRAGVTTLVGFAAGLHGELVDGFDGDETAGYGGDAALVGGYDAEPRIDVVGSVYLEVDACGARAVDRVGDRTGTGGEADHLREVAPVHRHLLHGLGVDDCDKSGGFGIGLNSVGRDIDDGALGANGEHDREVHGLGDGDVNTGDLAGLEAAGCYRKFVCSDRKLGEVKVAQTHSIWRAMSLPSRD